MGPNINEIIFFISFLVIIILLLVIDLGFFNKKSHILSFKEALSWSILWIAISILFYFIIRYHGNWIHGMDTIEKLQTRISNYHHPIIIQGVTLQQAIDLYNRNLSLEYLTGYLIEYALSVDNVFVIVMIFLSFNIEPRHYKRVLFWGILGAIIMRFLFIFAASALIQRFAWFLFIFGGLLVFIGGKMAFDFFFARSDQRIDTERHPVVKLASRFFHVTKENRQEKFWVRQGGKLFITPLFIVLLVIEFSDVLFAIDSVPAVFSVTEDPYIVFFSNIFAILGLRSLFFLLMNIINRFYYLKLGLAVLLTFVGLKMLGHEIYKIDTVTSLYIIAAILAVTMVVSIIRAVIFRNRKKHPGNEKGL